MTNLPSPSPSANAEFLDLQAALAGEYSLQREIGRGGMGIVYLARDVQLDRDVAAPRAAASKRLADAVAALEGIRLDLLRLHAGASDLAPLTTLMDAVRAIGDDMNRLAEAQQEVESATRGGAANSARDASRRRPSRYPLPPGALSGPRRVREPRAGS